MHVHTHQPPRTLWSPRLVLGISLPRRPAPPSQFYMASSVPPEEGGRTPLHMACQRDKDYTVSIDTSLQSVKL